MNRPFTSLYADRNIEKRWRSVFEGNRTKNSQNQPLMAKNAVEGNHPQGCVHAKRDIASLQSCRTIRKTWPTPFEKAIGGPYQWLHLIADAGVGEIINRFLSAVRSLWSGSNDKKLQDALKTGDLDTIIEALGSQDQQENTFSLWLRPTLTGIIADAGTGAAQQLARQGVMRMRFDLANPHTIEAANNYDFGLITGITDETRAAIKDIVSQAVEFGGHPYEQARRIRQLVGLTQAQVAAVDNYRNMLESGDAAALTRELRDHRFDGTLSRALGPSSSLALAPEQIDRMVDRYAERALAARAENIARTETLRAANLGQNEAWWQARDNGLIGDGVKRQWLVTPDDRLCEYCEAVPGMNPDGVSLEGAFETPLGPVDVPPLHPQCRCVTVISDLGKSITIGAVVAKFNPYHDEKGRFASSGAEPVGPEPEMFKPDLRRYNYHDSRAGYAEDLGLDPPQPGHTFLVYRAGGEGETSLSGRNAGTPYAVASFLASQEDVEKPTYGGPKPTTLYAYAVTLDKPTGKYSLQHSGIPTPGMDRVGRGAFRGNLQPGYASYAFGPEGAGYSSKPLGSVPLSTVRASMAAQGYDSFDDAGGNTGGLFIRHATFGAVRKYDPSEPRDELGRWTSGGGGGAVQHAIELFRQHDISPSKAEIMAAAPKGTAEKIAAVERAISQTVATDAPVSAGGFKNPDGTWTEERQKLHQQILEKIFNPDAVARATPAPGQQPTMVMIGGRGGSGKTWLSKGEGAPVDPSKMIILNSDDLKSELGATGWDAAKFHEESTDLLGQAEKVAMAARLNVAFDATMKSQKGAAERLLSFQNAGYRVEGYYMFTSPKESATRAMERFVRGGAEGRYVPIDVLLANRTNEETFDALKPSFDKWAIYDNNVRGRTPVLVARSPSR